MNLLGSLDPKGSHLSFPFDYKRGDGRGISHLYLDCNFNIQKGDSEEQDCVVMISDLDD